MLHHVLLMARHGIFTPVDPWAYIEMPPWHIPAQQSWEITYFEFDEKGYRAALTELALAGMQVEGAGPTTGQAVEVYRQVSGLLSTAADSVRSLRLLPIDSALVRQVEDGLADVRNLMGELIAGTLEQPPSRAADPVLLPPGPPDPVSRSTGSPHRSEMPDGTVVKSRDERFEFNLEAAREFYEAHGHLRPSTKNRPRGVNLYQWLKNQEVRIRKGTMEPERAEALSRLPGWSQRCNRE